MTLAPLPPAFEPGPMGVLQPVDAPLAPDPVSAGPVAIPPAIVARIAEAAVAAYIEQERERRRAYDRAYRKVNRDRLRELARARYERRRVHRA